MKWVLRIGAGVLGLLILVIGGAAAFIATLDKSFVEEQAKEATGRDLTFTALDLNLLSTTPSISARGIAFENAVWSENPYLATVDALDLQFKLFPLLSGVLDLERLVVSGVDVFIETNEVGASNLDFSGDGENAAVAEAPSVEEVSEAVDSAGGSPILPILRLVDISDVSVTISDARSGANNSVTLAEVSVRGDGADQPLNITVSGAADDLPITAQGSLGSPNAMLDSDLVWPLQLAGDLAGIGLQLDGQVQDPAGGAGIDVTFAVAGEELADAARIAGVDVPTIGAFDIRGALKGDVDDDLAIQDLSVEFGSTDFVRVDVSGGVASLVELDGVDLAIAVRGDETAALSPVAERFAGQAIPALGPFGLTAAIKGGQEDGVSLNDLDFSLGREALLLVTANGTVADLLSVSGVSVGFSVATPSVAALNPILEPYSPHPVPDLGALSVSGAVTGALDSAMQLSDLSVALGDASLISVQVNGGIGNLLEQSGLDIDLAVTSDQIGALSPLAQQFAGQNVPALGPLSLSAEIAGGLNDVVRVSDIALSLGEESILEVAVTGGIDDALNQRGIDLDIQVESDEIAALSPIAQEFAGQSVPALGALQISADVSGDMDAGISLSDLDLKLGEETLIAVAVTGGIADLLAQKGIELRVKAEGVETANLSDIAQSFGGQGVPSFGPFSVTAKVEGAPAERFKLDDLVVSVGSEEKAKLSISGAVEDLVALTGVDIGLAIDSPDLSKASTKEFQLPAIAPVEIRARAVGSLTESLEVNGLSAKLGESDLAGTISAALDGGIPRVKVALTSTLLDLAALQSQASSGESSSSSSSGSTTASGGGSQSSDGRVIPADPLPLDALKLVNADVSVKVAKLVLNLGEMSNAEIGISLEGGDLQVTPFKANAAGGLVSGGFKLLGSKDVPTLEVGLKGDNLDIGGIMDLAGAPGVINGPLTLDVGITGLGNNPRAIAATLDGTAKLVVANGLMNKSAMIENFGSGVTTVTEILFANKENVVVECLYNDLTFDQGVAEINTGVLETEISTVEFDGDIDLRVEEIDLDVTPKGSVAGFVDIGVPVAIGGTLAKPSYGIQVEKVAIGVISGLLTGGVAPVVGSLVLDGFSSDHPCSNLKVSEPKAAPAASGGAQPAAPAAAAPATPAAPAQEAVKGLIKGLFGN